MFIAISILLISCADVKRPEQLDRIDTFSSEIDSMLEAFKSIDTSLIREMYESSLELGNSLEAFSGDTLSYELGVSIDRVHQMGINSAYLHVELKEIIQLLEHERELIQALRSDIKNGNGRRDKYDEHIEFEKTKIDTLSARFNDCIRLFEEAEKIYIDQFPDVVVNVEEKLTNREQLLNKEEE